MATDPKKRQKKLERRAAKRKSKQHLLVKDAGAGLEQRLAAAAGHPITHCGATEDLWKRGLGWVWVSRELPNGSIAYAVFLVDRSCLGVKDVMTDITSRSTFESKFMHKLRRQFTARDLTPAAARKLVEGAVDYARRLGLAPHADYHKAHAIFGTVDPASCAEDFEFGEKGKPHFMAGPYDSAERCHTILSALLRSCGPDGFHYTLPLGISSRALPEPLRQQPARIIGQAEDGTIREYAMDGDLS